MKTGEITSIEDLGGRFASPVFQGEYNKIDMPFTYDSRALLDDIQEGTVYIKFKIIDYSDLEFKYGNAIPWKNRKGEVVSGNAKQIESNKGFHTLAEESYEIIQKSVFKGGKWIDIIPDKSLKIDDLVKKIKCD